MLASVRVEFPGSDNLYRKMELCKKVVWGRL